MKTIGNFVWFIFLGGLFSSLLWFLFGAIMAVTIIGLPVAYAAFRIGRFAAFPFGKELVDARLVGEKRITGTTLINILWFLLAGLWLAIAHVILAMACIASCVLIIPLLLGAPAWALAHLRLARVSLAPLGKRVVPIELASEIRKQQFNARLNARGT